MINKTKKLKWRQTLNFDPYIYALLLLKIDVADMLSQDYVPILF